jgi:ABC-type nitrate/sulfonate/bicarbonate transport system substrate-binding protein
VHRCRGRRSLSDARGWIAALAAVAWLGLGCAPSAEPAKPAASSEAAAASTALPLQTVRVAYSSLWGANAVPWTAYEAGIFARHGLDAQLSYISSAQTVLAALSGEVDVSLGGGYAAMASRLGGSDLSIFFNLTNWSPYELMVTPDISSAADLQGKRLGVSRLGSASDVATRTALQKLNLVPERDVIILQTGGLTERIAAMRAGALAGGVAVPPDNLILRREGFTTLLDLGASGDPELTNTAFATARWLEANPGTAQGFTDALIEGIQFAKANRAFTERVLAKYLELDDAEAVAECYDHFVAQHLTRLPDLAEEAGRNYLASLAATDERATGARAADFFDGRFVERAQATGLVDRLYPR